MQQQGLQQYIRITREKFVNDETHVRLVYISQFNRHNEDIPIDQYIADKAPLFYRQLNKVIESLQDEALLTSVRETLAKLPTSETFQDSHFGEILAGLFCQDILQLKKIYSKLSLLTAENANAYKMDLVLYDPKTEPIEIYFGEVKFSPKLPENGNPVRHDESCFKSLFDSFNAYTIASQDFDFAAAKDHLDHLPENDKIRLKKVLKPYSNRHSADLFSRIVFFKITTEQPTDPNNFIIDIQQTAVNSRINTFQHLTNSPEQKENPFHRRSGSRFISRIHDGGITFFEDLPEQPFRHRVYQKTEHHQHG